MTSISIHDIKKVIVDKQYDLYPERKNIKTFVSRISFIDKEGHKTTITIFSEDKKVFIK